MQIKSCDMKGYGFCPCSLEGFNEVLIGKKWTISVIITIGNYGTIRFNELSKKLKNISPKTLADRLKELEKHKIINKKIYPQIPPKTEYSLTQEGKKLRNSLIPVMKWVDNRNNKKRIFLALPQCSH